MNYERSIAVSRKQNAATAVAETEKMVSFNDDLAGYQPRTELGRKLLALRAKIVASGIPLLNWDDAEREITEMRR